MAARETRGSGIAVNRPGPETPPADVAAAPYRPNAVSAFLDAHPWIFQAAFASVLVLYVLVDSAHVARIASYTTDENRYVDDPMGVRIVSVDPNGASDRAGIRPGDRIVAVNGKAIHNTKDAMRFIVEGEKGRALIYTVDRGGKRFNARVVLADFGIPLTLVALLLTAALFVFAGAFVGLRRPAHAVARLFGWAMTITGCGIPLAFSYNYPAAPDIVESLRSHLQSVSLYLAFPLMYHLFLLFPVRRFAARYPLWMTAAIYALPLAAVLVLAAIPGASGLVGMLVVGLLIGGLETLFQTRLRRARNPEYGPKARLALVALGIVIVTNVLIALGQALPGIQALTFILVATPALIFFTVIRYRIFDLYVVVRRSSLYSTSRIAVNVAAVVLFLVMVNVLASLALDIPVPRLSSRTLEFIRLSSLGAESRAVAEKVVYIVAACLGLLVIRSIRARARRALDDRFSRGAYDYRAALHAFSTLTTQFLAPEELGRRVVNDLTTLVRLKGAAFALRAGNGFAPLAVRDLPGFPRVDPEPAAEPPWMAALESRKSPQAVDNLGAHATFDGTGVEFIAPVLLDGRVEALMFLGEKRAETKYTRDDVELLETLCANVADAMMLGRFYEGARERERMRRELEIARKIQLNALPAELPAFPGIDIAASSRPAMEVGGDFYDFLTRHDAITCIVGDVSGKGTSSALYLSRIQGILRAIDSYGPTLWELFTRLNTQAYDLTDRNVFVTASAVRIGLLSRGARFLRAGHLPLLHYRAAADDTKFHRPRGIGIGMDANRFGEFLEEVELDPAEGDVFTLVSDGVTEAVDTGGNEFGIERVADVVRAHAGESAAGIQEALLAALDAFRGAAPQHDDMTVVVVKFT